MKLTEHCRVLAVLLAVSSISVGCARGIGTNTPTDTGTDHSMSDENTMVDGSVTMDTTTDDTGNNPVDSPMDDTRPSMDIVTDTQPDTPDVGRPDVCIPSMEVCNGLDDNCNGSVDEGVVCPDHLLLSEVVTQPNEYEFIEIYNPTSQPIPLGNVYLADTSIYPRLFAAMGAPPVDDSDFVAQFPMNATIGPGERQTIATSSPSTWGMVYGTTCPTYHLQSTATLGGCTSSTVMRSIPGIVTSAGQPRSIGASASLTNVGEPVVLFRWDGMNDLVQDLDYVYYGAPGATGGNSQVDKSMLVIDGPDPDTTAAGYRLDTPPAQQQRAGAPALGGSVIRCNNTEGTERLNGGNGLWGHDETSEDLMNTWRVLAPLSPADAGQLMQVNATPNQSNNCL